MRRLIFLGAAGVLILVVVILSLLSAFGGKSDGGQSTGNGTSSAVTEDGKLVIQDLYEGEITIPKFNVPLNTYDQSKFKNDNGLVTYDDANASLGGSTFPTIRATSTGQPSKRAASISR